MCNPVAVKAAEELHARSKGYVTPVRRHSAIAQVGVGPNCFQVLGSSPGLLLELRSRSNVKIRSDETERRGGEGGDFFKAKAMNE